MAKFTYTIVLFSINVIYTYCKFFKEFLYKHPLSMSDCLFILKMCQLRISALICVLVEMAY